MARRDAAEQHERDRDELRRQREEDQRALAEPRREDQREVAAKALTDKWRWRIATGVALVALALSAGVGAYTVFKPTLAPQIVVVPADQAPPQQRSPAPVEQVPLPR